MEEENIIKKENEVLNTSNNSNNKNGIIAILVVIIIALIGVVIYFAFIKKDDKPVDNNGGNNQTNNGQTNNNEKKYSNTFVYDETGSYGIAYVTGYAKVERVPYCGAIGAECTEQNASSINDEVEFFVTKNDSEYLQKEIDSWYGDGYTGDKTISLGCKKNDVISYINAADEFQDSTKEITYGSNFKSFTLDSNNTNKIINSNKNNLIVLKLTKLKLSNGGEAPSCYSHFAYVEVVE